MEYLIPINHFPKKSLSIEQDFVSPEKTPVHQQTYHPAEAASSESQSQLFFTFLRALNTQLSTQSEDAERLGSLEEGPRT